MTLAVLEAYTADKGAIIASDFVADRAVVLFKDFLTEKDH